MIAEVSLLVVVGIDIDDLDGLGIMKDKYYSPLAI
jgi:hypothetical protein